MVVKLRLYLLKQDASEVLPKLVLVLPELGGRVLYILVL